MEEGLEIKNIEALIGRTFLSVLRMYDRFDGQDSLRFEEAETGRAWSFTHNRDCCEDVQIEDICGDLTDLEGAPLLIAEAATKDNPNEEGSGTWTFYRFATRKGTVTVRWYGSSNGYYGTEVDLVEEEPK